MTEGQKQNMDKLWPRYGLDVDGESELDPSSLFQRHAPLWLEVGFGRGESLAHIAANHPDVNLLGIEVHLPGVGHALGELAERDVDNVRLIRYDALEVLNHCLPANSVERFLLWFPDPWRKLRHHKRRMVNEEFIALVNRVLQPGGVIHFATDWQPYAEWIEKKMAGQQDLLRLTDEQQVQSIIGIRPPTKFEQRGLKLGHEVSEMVYQKSVQ